MYITDGSVTKNYVTHNIVTGKFFRQ